METFQLPIGNTEHHFTLKCSDVLLDCTFQCETSRLVKYNFKINDKDIKNCNVKKSVKGLSNMLRNGLLRITKHVQFDVRYIEKDVYNNWVTKRNSEEGEEGKVTMNDISGNNINYEGYIDINKGISWVEGDEEDIDWFEQKSIFQKNDDDSEDDPIGILHMTYDDDYAEKQNYFLAFKQIESDKDEFAHQDVWKNKKNNDNDDEKKISNFEKITELPSKTLKKISSLKTTKEFMNYIQEETLEGQALKQKIIALEKQVEIFDSGTFETRLRLENATKYFNKNIKFQDCQRNVIGRFEAYVNKLHKQLDCTVKQDKIRTLKLAVRLQRDIVKEKQHLVPIFDGSFLNDEHQEIVLKWVSKVHKSMKGIENGKLIYSSTKHPKSNQEFHKRCDRYSRTLTFIKTTTGDILGGYNPMAWTGKNGYKYLDGRSFLFSLEDSNGSKPTLCEINNPNTRISQQYSPQNYGPHWGNNLVVHNMTSGNVNVSQYNQGLAYRSFTIADIEVYSLGGNQVIRSIMIYMYVVIMLIWILSS